MIKFIEGERKIWGCKNIVVPVNCVGVMGAGMALEAKNRIKGINRFYRDIPGPTPGSVVPYNGASDYDEVFLAFTKGHWKYPSQKHTIIYCLRNLSNICDRLKIATVGVPKLGCGLGNLDWEEMKLEFIRILAPGETIYNVYE